MKNKLVADDVKIEPCTVTPHPHHADSGIRAIYPPDNASWIWHPETPSGTPCFLNFSLDFKSDGTECRIHVTGDQYFELLCNGKIVASGPPRGDVNRWYFQSFSITFPKGENRLEARVWWLGSHSPQGRTTWQGGFVLAAEGAWDEKLSTGRAPWKVARLSGVDCLPHQLMYTYHVAGDAFKVDAEKYYSSFSKTVAPSVVRSPLKNSPHGIVADGWKLAHSDLPILLRGEVGGGKIRAVMPGLLSQNDPVHHDPSHDKTRDSWQKLISGGTPVVVPPRTTISVLWDMEQYYCAFPKLQLDGGEGATVDWFWAESLYQLDCPHGSHIKGDRNEVEGKKMWCFGDTFIADGKKREMPSFWWRAGRYSLIRVQTGAKPLTVCGLSAREIHYPIGRESHFVCSDKSLLPVADICVRTLEMCAHDVYYDCPYFEQLMYTADTRVQMLINYVLTGDDRLAKQGMELFDHSRHWTGFVAMRYPSRQIQQSGTFALFYVDMVRDHLYWRDDREFVKKRLPGVRSLLEAFAPYENRLGLIAKLPGWVAIEPTPVFPGGVPEGEKSGEGSATVNLQYVMALQDAADIEDAVGEKVMAQHYRRKAQAIQKTVMKHFWNARAGLLFDNLKKDAQLEHLQILAILTGTLNAAQVKKAADVLVSRTITTSAQLYFSYYLFEAFRVAKRGDQVFERMDTWKQAVASGCKTTPEFPPDPTRSECHAWSAHPVFHMHATLAGIRPMSPGFSQVLVQPEPGSLEFLESSVPHPRGTVSSKLSFQGKKCSGEIRLPKGVTGLFKWKGRTVKLASGKNKILC